MQIVHYGHSCVVLETGSARLMFDPGAFSRFEQARDLDAVLITHQHADHLDPARLPALLAANPGAQLIVDEDSEDIVRGLDLTYEVIRLGETADVAGMAVKAVGGRHAEIYREIPRPVNIGYLVDGGAFYHPGDALHVPEEKVDVLGLPTGAPWLKLGEAIDFLRAVAPRVAVPIHEAVLSAPGIQISHSLFTAKAPERTTVTVLADGKSTEV